MSKRIYLETFGCQMNVLDSQLVTSQLRAAGYQFIDDWKQADVVLYNTCSVRDHAEQKVLSRLGEVAIRKRQHPQIVLGVLGCMAERAGVDLIKQYPQVDLLCGPGELDKVPLLIDNAMRTDPSRRGNWRSAPAALGGNNHRRAATLAAAEDQLESLDLSRSFWPDEVEASAYVRITRGCNKCCSFCVVPQTRGREIHRPPQHIIDECRKLVDAGAKEITLLGQTVNHYHFDHSSAVTVNGITQPQIGGAVTATGIRGIDQASAKNAPQADAQQSNARLSDAGPSDAQASSPRRITGFADLLHQIHEQVPELPRLRFVTSFPRDFGDDILQVMAQSPRICRYLHLPVQSGSDRMLKRMNRDYTVQQYIDLIDRVREHLPDAQIASDLICGFPGETEADHEATMKLLEYCRFKNCFIFKYSPRPGTASAQRYEDDVAEVDKKRRNNELLAVQKRISDEIHQSLVGQTVRVLVQSISAKQEKAISAAAPGHAAVELGWQSPGQQVQLTGRTEGDLIVLFDGSEQQVGSIVDVEIQKAATLALFGKLSARHAAEHAPQAQASTPPISLTSPT